MPLSDTHDELANLCWAKAARDLEARTSQSFLHPGSIELPGLKIPGCSLRLARLDYVLRLGELTKKDLVEKLHGVILTALLTLCHLAWSTRARSKGKHVA